MADFGERGRTPARRTAAACWLGIIAATSLTGPVRADAPPWTRDSGTREAGAREAGAQATRKPAENQIAYRFPPGLKDGRCRPEMFKASAVHGLLGAAGNGLSPSRPRNGKRTKLAATAIDILMAAVSEKREPRDISRRDEICFSQSFEHAPDRTTVAWSDIGHAVQYSVMPMRTLRTSDGRYCREYAAKATVNGHAADVYGTACRQADGRWILID